MNQANFVFNPPPGWPVPPDGWQAPAGWQPDPSWPEPPQDWPLWLPQAGGEVIEHSGIPETSLTSSPINEAPPSGETCVERLQAENAKLRFQLYKQSNSDEEVISFDDERVLQSVGIYRYHHPLENAIAYKERLQSIGIQIADLVRVGKAIEKSTMFTFDNSLAKGRKMTTDLSKLMLRAYNAEAENGIRILRLGNVVTAKKRLEASRNSIAKLGRMMEMRISDAFHSLRIQEIELTADWLMKKQEEREAAREEQSRLREQKKVEEELAEQRAALDKEREHLQNALQALRESGAQDKDLESRIADIDAAIAENDYRTANIRAGYVYVISNRGAFGLNVVKIGLTRRLEPLQRISELSGASVPFRFDIHALFFSEDAVTLENELHKHFAARAVNRANKRKEFFFATPTEVRDVLTNKIGNLLEFSESAEATEYFQSLHYWPNDIRSPEVQFSHGGS